MAIKNQQRDNQTGLLIQLANSVPESISLTDGLNPGELVVKVPRVKGSTSYGAQYTFDPLTAESEWKSFMTSSSKYTFTNLVSGKKYWARMAVIGPYNQLVYSDAVCRIAQ